MDSFEARGYAVIPEVLSNAECVQLKQALSASVSGRAGSRHLMLNAAVRALANDGKLTALARRALSSTTAMPFRATLFNKTSKANWLIPWHQDTALPLTNHSNDPEWTSWSQKGGIWHAHAPEWALKQVVALRLHLDPSTPDNGPLRAIPGSHTHLLSDAQVDEHVAAAVHATSIIECPESGVIAMRPLLIHASSKIVNDSPRRVLHIEYTPSLSLKPGHAGTLINQQRSRLS